MTIKLTLKSVECKEPYENYNSIFHKFTEISGDGYSITKMLFYSVLFHFNSQVNYRIMQ